MRVAFVIKQSSLSPPSFLRLYRLRIMTHNQKTCDQRGGKENLYLNAFHDAFLDAIYTSIRIFVFIVFLFNPCLMLRAHVCIVQREVHEKITSERVTVNCDPINFVI